MKDLNRRAALAALATVPIAAAEFPVAARATWPTVPRVQDLESVLVQMANIAKLSAQRKKVKKPIVIKLSSTQQVTLCNWETFRDLLLAMVSSIEQHSPMWNWPGDHTPNCCSIEEKDTHM